MRRNRLLLPWGLLAGLLIAIAVVEGLNIKPPSLLKKPRNHPTTAKTTPLTTTTTSTTTTEAPETTTEAEADPESVSEDNVTTPKSNLTGNPQLDYVYDPNLPRELPKGYNLSSYPFFERVPENVKYECDGKLDGYYANIEFKCQIYHHCLSDIRYDFLCPNYTAFDQRTFNCHFVSEVDCENSAKYWFRNEPLYKGRITTTEKPTTTAAAPTTPRRPAGGRRRRPYRRRRPQYDDDYYDDYEEDDYDDDSAGTGKGRQRKRQRRPGSIAAADAEEDDKPLKPNSSVYDRPRVLPKIRRPVPANERDKYDYKTKGGSTAVNGGGEKNPEKAAAPAVADSDKDAEKPKRPIESPTSSPAPEVDKPRDQEPRSRPQKPRPQDDDDEYYDDEDYDQPVRKTPRKNQQDYYAPSGGDRDFSRRPAKSGAGRPLRRNRPGRRRPAPVEYEDDDYEDDRRPYRPSAPARYNQKSRKRPHRDDYYDDEEYERPSYRDTKRPSSSRDSYDRPSATRDSAYDRPSSSSRDSSRMPTRDSTYDRPAPAARDPAYERPATPTRDATFERPAPAGRDPAYERPATPTRDSAYDRPAPSSRVPAYDRQATAPRDSIYERQAPLVRDTGFQRPAANTRDTGYEKPATPSRETAFDRQAQTSRGKEYDRESPNAEEVVYTRPSSKETSYERLSGNKKRFQSPTVDSAQERPRQDRPSSRGNSDYEHAAVPDSTPSLRVQASRSRFTTPESEEPIPAARPAYISTTGRSSYRKRGPEEVATGSGSRGGLPRTAPKVTEPPALLDDEEYYDDEEDVEEELPQNPTGSGRTQTGSYRDPPVESRKPSTSRGGEPEVVHNPRNTQSTETRSRGVQPIEEHKEGSYQPTEDRDRSRPFIKDRERIGQVPPTGRGRLPPVTDDTKTRSRFGDDDNSKTRTDARVSVGKPSPIREQSRSNTNRATESILEQPPVKSTQGNLRTKDNSGDESTPHRQGFRPTGSAETTSDKYSNFRRKPSSGSGVEAKTAAQPPREDRVVEIAEDIHIAPSSQGRSQATGDGLDETLSQVDVELESETSQEDSSKQLDTSKFISAEAEAKEEVAPSGPTGQGFNNDRNAQKPSEDETEPMGRGAKAQEIPDDTPHRNELPDINDPEYDVTLNEALQPTRPILLSTEGAVGKKNRIPNYHYRDVSLEPELTGPDSEKLAQTLLTSASHTHVSKAPFPAHAKEGRYRRPIPTSTARVTPQYDDYDDQPIPTGKGGTTVTYSTTESVFRASQQQSPISLSSRGASGQQFPSSKGSTQYVHFPSTPATGTLRQLEEELAKTLPRARIPPPPYRSPSQGTIREAEFYRGSIEPISLSLGYDVDYDQSTKYRPRRKLVWRDRFHDFYNIY